MSEFDLLGVAADGMARRRASLDLSARNVAFAQADGGDFTDALTEMVAMLDAQRAYEADATIFDTGKRLVERTLDLGRP
jgi:flagellar basal body rod protein FlgC